MNYYASTSGLAGNSGAIGSPWDLRTALSNASQTSGDTLYLRGGTYYGRYISTLDGGTVRPYTGETVKIDGYATTTLTSGINDTVTTFDVGSTEGMFSSMTIIIDDEDMQVASVVDANTVTVTRAWSGTTAVSHSAAATVYHYASYILNIAGGSSTTYRDLEIYNSGAFRDEQTSRAALAIGTGIVVNGSADGNSLINNVIHDCGSGIFIGSATSNTTVYGNVGYNCGVIAIDGNEAGMGIYSENASGYSRIYDNIFVNNWNFNGQFYGVSGPYVGGDHRGNIWANAGSFNGDSNRNFNIIIGPNSVPTDTASVTDSHFFQPTGVVGGASCRMGYGAGITALTFNDNYVVGSPAGLVIDDVGTITGSGNNFYLNSATFGDTEVFYTPATLPTGTFNNNTYHNATGNDYFGANGVGYFDFATWKTNTGFDASSSQTGVDMPDTVVVIPNTEETGRAHVAIYAPSNPGTIDVNLATTGLIDGQAYVLKNAFDYYGSNVATGSYDSGDPIVTLTLTDMDSVATPSGWGFTPQTTVPDFAVLLVIPSETISSQASGGVTLRGSVSLN